MKIKLLTLAGLSVMGTLGMASMAQAQTASQAPASPWYGTFELGAGRVSSGAVGNGLSANGLTGSVDRDRTRAATGLSLGYQFTPNFALEGGYYDLGHYKYGATITAPAADSISGRWRASGLKLAAVGTIPVTRDFSVYGKGGVFFSQTEFDGYGASTAVDQTKNRAVLTVGLGGAYALTPQLDATAGWDRYQGLGSNATTGKGNVDVYSVGLKYKF